MFSYLNTSFKSFSPEDVPVGDLIKKAAQPELSEKALLDKLTLDIGVVLLLETEISYMCTPKVAFLFFTEIQNI